MTILENLGYLAIAIILGGTWYLLLVAFWSF